MIILAIDPGPVESAYVLYDTEARSVLRFDKVRNDIMLTVVKQSALYNAVTIEMIASYGMPVGREVFETCVFIGRIIESVPFGRHCDRLTRMMVKSHICHSAKANDANIRQAIIDRYGGTPAIKKGGPLYKVSGDVWAALAVAIAAAETTQRY